MKDSSIASGKIDDYRIVSLLGEGSTGRVYLVKRNEDFFALKILEKGNVHELISEFFILKGLRHPKIIEVYSVNVRGDKAYAILEYAEGGSLNGKYFKKNWKFFVKKLIDDVLPALEFLHKSGVLHGDIKPSNILVTSEGTFKLSDLGGVLKYREPYRLVKNESFTINYTAPEIFMGERATTQSDLYSLGMLMYETLTGCLPFEGSIETVINGHLIGVVKPPHEINPNLPESLSNFIVKMLEKSPLRRPSGVKEVKSVLSKILENKTYKAEFSSIPILIGRGKELRIAESLFKRIVEGEKNRNNVLVFYGSEGIGKSALADEIVCRAYLQGIFAIRFDLKADNYTTSLRRLGDFLQNFLNQQLPTIGNSNLRHQFVHNIYNTLKILSNRFPVLIVIDEFPPDDQISWQILSDVLKLIKRDRIGIIVFTEDIIKEYLKGVNSVYRLQPLAPGYIREFLRNKGVQLNKAEIFKIYNVTRGVPKRIVRILDCLSKGKKLNECFEENKSLVIKIDSLPESDKEILKFMGLMGNPIELKILIDRFGIKRVSNSINKLLSYGILKRLNYYTLNDSVRDQLLNKYSRDRVAVFRIARKFLEIRNYRRASRILYDAGYFSSSFEYIEPALKRAFMKRNYIKLYDLLRPYEDVSLINRVRKVFLSYYVYTLINLGMYSKALKIIENNYDQMEKSESDFLRCYALKELGYPVYKLISLMETNVNGHISGFLRDDAASLYAELISGTDISQEKFDSIIGEMLKRKKRPDVRVKLLRILGNYHFNRRNYQKAKNFYREGLRLARKKDIHWEIPNLLMNLTVSQFFLGEIRPKDYLENLKNAARLAEKQANYPVLEKVYPNIAIHYLTYNLFNEAEVFLEKLKHIGELSDNPALIAKYYENIALLNFDRGIWNNVEEYYMKAYENYKNVRFPDIEFYCKYIQFLVHIGNFTIAIRLSREALSFWKRVASKRVLAIVYKYLFVALQVTGRKDMMERFLSRVPEDIRNVPGVSYTVAFAKRDFHTALKVVNDVIELLRPTGENIQIRYYLEKAETLLSLGDVEGAFHYIKIYLERKPEGAFREALAYFILAKIYLARKDWSNSLLNFERAKKIFEQLGARYQLGKTLGFITYVRAIYREQEPEYEELNRCRKFLNSVGARGTLDEIKLEILDLLEK